MNRDTRETSYAFRHGHDYTHAVKGRDIVSREDVERVRAEALAEQNAPVTPFDR